MSCRVCRGPAARYESQAPIRRVGAWFCNGFSAMLQGSQSEVAPIRRVLVKHARDAFVSPQVIGTQWQRLDYAAPPDFERALDEYDRFVSLLGEHVAEITYLPYDETVGLDSIYVRDPAMVCESGVVLGNMGKVARTGEPDAQRAAYEALGIPILGAVGGEGRLEGGDVVWLDERTLAIGRGYRTNDAGIEQVRRLLSNRIDELIVVPLPHYRGPSDVFHLMSILSPIDRDLMLVYSPLMPVMFREWLSNRGYRLVEVCDAEFGSLGCNVLSVAPRRCIMLGGNPVTRGRLTEAGADVYEYDGSEISVAGAGGPTCLTRPLSRE